MLHNDIHIYSGITELKNYFESFNQLYDIALDGDYRLWFTKGYWDEHLLPFFVVKEGIVVANVCVAPMELIMGNDTVSVLQISTVMTHPEYRRQGLSRYLMEHVMNKYKNQYEFMYLFANESVLDFYPKFGFVRVDESSYKLHHFDTETRIDTKWKRLSIEDEGDLKLLEALVKDHVLLSKKLAFRTNYCLAMFHFLLQFDQSLYYCKELNCLVIMEYENKTLRVYDVLSKGAFDWNDLIRRIVKKQTKEIQFFFVPDTDFNGELKVEKDPFDDDALFIYPLKRELLPEHFMFPITSHF